MYGGWYGEYGEDTNWDWQQNGGMNVMMMLEREKEDAKTIAATTKKIAVKTGDDEQWQKRFGKATGEFDPLMKKERMKPIELKNKFNVLEAESDTEDEDDNDQHDSQNNRPNDNEQNDDDRPIDNTMTTKRNLNQRQRRRRRETKSMMVYVEKLNKCKCTSEQCDAQLHDHTHTTQHHYTTPHAQSTTTTQPLHIHHSTFHVGSSCPAGHKHVLQPPRPHAGAVQHHTTVYTSRLDARPTPDNFHRPSSQRRCQNWQSSSCSMFISKY